MNIAAIYLRVSTTEQAREGFSIGAQLKAIKEYAKRNNYIIDPKYIYKDEGISGRKAEKRPAFMNMISTAKSKEKPFKTILVHKLDRFARNREDSIVYKSLLKRECGVQVISITEDFGDDKFSILIEAMLEAMAEYYSLNLSDEVIKGMKEKALKGGIQTKAPFGYIKKEDTYVQDLEKAKIVEMIFDDYNNGTSFKGIAQKLNKLGIKTIRNNKWEVRTVEYLLRNPAYKGYIVWAEGAKSSWDISNRQNNGIYVKSTFKAIIDEELFDKVQKKIMETKEKYKHYSSTTNNHWLRKLIKCGNCESTLTIMKNAFQCIGYSHGSCEKSHYIPITKIERLVLEDIKTMVNNKEISMNVIYSKKDLNNEYEIINNKITSTEETLIRCKNLYLEGIDSIEEYKENKDKYSRMLKELKEELSKIPVENTNKESNNVRIKAKSVYELLISDENMNIKYDYAHELIEKIVYNKTEKTIDIFYKI